MSIADTLRERWAKAGDATLGLETIFENAIRFIEAPASKKAELQNNDRLSDVAVAEDLRSFLAKGVVPELRRARQVIDDGKEALKQQRDKLSMPEIDRTDTVAVEHRKEARELLRGLSDGARTQLLLKNPDPLLVAAVLELPNFFSGISPEIRQHVQAAYLEKHNAEHLTAIARRDEALSVLGAAVTVAANELQKHAGLGSGADFDQWFETGEEPKQAA